MPERFEVYSVTVEREGEPPETRYSLSPVGSARYAGRDEPIGAEPQDSGAGEASQPEPAGVVEAPDGTVPASLDPPVLEIPGQGRVDLHAVIGATEGSAENLGHLVRWRPR